MRGKRALLLLTALSLVLTLLAGCGNTAPETGEKAMVIGDTTFNSENWEETVDPHRTYNGWACIRYGIGETLVRYTDSMELEPWLAKSWSNDGDRTWTIVLQDDVTFSSGRKMDAAAVKQCLEHLLENHDRRYQDRRYAGGGPDPDHRHQSAQSCPDELSGGPLRLHHRRGRQRL